MNDKSLELLQKIAVDVAVIKNKIDHLEELEVKVEAHSVDLASLKTQISIAQWLGGVVGVAVIGVIIRNFTGA